MKNRGRSFSFRLHLPGKVLKGSVATDPERPLNQLLKLKPGSQNAQCMLKPWEEKLEAQLKEEKNKK